MFHVGTMKRPLEPETTVQHTLLVEAAPETVWKALTEPHLARLYMSATPTGEMKPGNSVQWFIKEEDGSVNLAAKGVVLAVHPGERLRYSTYSPTSELPDEPASHTTVDFHLVPENDGRTRVEFWQGDFMGLPQAVRRARAAGREWVERLVGLKRVAEEQEHAMAA